MKEYLAGYAWLSKELDLCTLPHHQLSQISVASRTPIAKQRGHSDVVAFAPSYLKENTVAGHLMFAIKNEGVSLGILSQIFAHPGTDAAITAMVNQSPTGRFGRLLWMLYEQLTGQVLSLPDCTQGAYQDALDSGEYYTAAPVNMKRYRIRDNFLGPLSFCPVVRRTEFLADTSNEVVSQGLDTIFADFDPEQLARAARYLISAETRSTNEIENESVTGNRFVKFMGALEQAGTRDLDKKWMLKVHNIIKDKHHREFDFRTEQNYIGKTGRYGIPAVDFLPPAPEDAHLLMDDWFVMRERVLNSDIPALVKAAVLSFSFVYVHPFMDGNGRISRYIIQDVLQHDGLLPDGIILPVSAGILTDLDQYIATLNLISKPLMKQVDYQLSDNLNVTDVDAPDHLYRYHDYTEHCGYLVRLTQDVIARLLPEELFNLEAIDKLTDALDVALDISDKDRNIIVKLLLQNDGRISKTKADGLLRGIDKADIVQAEEIYAETFKSSPAPVLM